MPAPLSETQIAAYRRDGFLMPLDLFTTTGAAAMRAELEAIEASPRARTLPHPLNQYLRVNAQVVIPMMTRAATYPSLLDAVESLLGPNLMIWSAEFFTKEPGSEKIVAWHQDLTYWGLGETDHEVTAWIALSDVSRASGCMRFIPGSHRQSIVDHCDTFADHNLLSRGQEIAVEVDEADAVYNELRPGQVSLHHGRLFHASGPNRSNDRRIALAIRYITPEVCQQVADRDYAMLVRGADRDRNWTHIAPPSENFAPAALRLYDEIIADQAKALASGAAAAVGLYASAGANP